MSVRCYMMYQQRNIAYFIAQYSFNLPPISEKQLFYTTLMLAVYINGLDLVLLCFNTRI